MTKTYPEHKKEVEAINNLLQKIIVLPNAKEAMEDFVDDLKRTEEYYKRKSLKLT